jgi:hypothetical protein
MQKSLLTDVGWRCEVPTARGWLYPLWLAAGVPPGRWRSDVCHLAKFAAEAGLLSVDASSLPASLHAAGAVYYARAVVAAAAARRGDAAAGAGGPDEPLWTPALAAVSGHDAAAAAAAARVIQTTAYARYGRRGCTLTAVYRKFSAPAYGRVAEKFAADLAGVAMAGADAAGGGAGGAAGGGGGAGGGPERPLAPVGPVAGP